MATDLYETLGVPPGSSDAQIKASYRRAAKRAHPDAGGSAEAFGQVERAKRVLLDPRRRARYDATGEIDEQSADNDVAQAMSLVMQNIDQVIAQIEGSGGAAENVDLVGVARSNLKQFIGKIEQEGEQARRQIERLHKLAKRFKAKRGKQNRIAAGFEHKALEVERARAARAENLRIVKLAYDIVGEHEFDAEAGAAPQYGRSSVFFSMMGS